MGWRRDIKVCLLRGFKSKCTICEYDTCNEALEFHHLDPDEKDFSISSFKIENISNIIKELKKCVCVCANCHRELHNELIKIPENVIRYNCKKSKDIVEYCKDIYDGMMEKKKKKLRKKKLRRYRNQKKKNSS